MNEVTRKWNVFVGMLLLLVLVWGGSVHAAWLENVPVTIVQPNGDTLHLFATGDEYYHNVHDANGYTIIEHPETGYYVYADKVNGKLIATQLIVGRSSPIGIISRPRLTISNDEYYQKRLEMEGPHPYKSSLKRSSNSGPDIINHIVIFISFADDPVITKNFSEVDYMLNSTNSGARSVYNYFKTVSYNSTHMVSSYYPIPDGDQIYSYVCPLPKSYFQPHSLVNLIGYSDSNERREREVQLLENAIVSIQNDSPIPDTLNIDSNNDGIVDVISFVVNCNVDGRGDLLWPHQWEFDEDTPIRINGKKPYLYTFELIKSDVFYLNTFCHELNHVFGAPDFYHSMGMDDYPDNPNPLGRWDIMCNSHDDLTGNHTSNPSAYIKWKYLNWIDEIPTITEPGVYTLKALGSHSTQNAYKIASSVPNQYYVLEYRNNDDFFDENTYGKGLVIYRVNEESKDYNGDGYEDYYGNLGAYPALGKYDELYVFRPDGTITNNGWLSAAFYSSESGRVAFNQTTNPAPCLSDGTPDRSISIFDVSEAGDTISFTYGCNIEATAFPEQGGTVTGDGLFAPNSSCTVTATPNPGFAFMGWYNNALGSILYSRQPEYTFTVTHDRNLVAKFVPGSYTVTTSCSPSNGGTISGNQGTYTVGSTVTLTATANTGYAFSCWTEDGQVLSNQPTYSFQIRSDRHLVANFMNLSFSIGDVITNPDGSKGVVFYINPTYTGGCMVALEDVSTGCQWGNSGDIQFLRNYARTKHEERLSDLDGYANTTILRDYQATNANYASGKVDYEHGWYVPSAGQLRKIFSALPFIENAITNAGGTKLVSNASYWSSTERSETNAWMVGAAIEVLNTSKTSNCRLRAVHDFSINNTMHVQLGTNNAELGNVAGTGFYPSGSQVTVTATPTGDNLFRGWTEAGHLVSQDLTYTFSANSNRELVANFSIRGGIGTLVTNPDGSQGILFHLNEDGSQGLMVALNDASEGCQWGPASDIRIMKDRSFNHQRFLEDQSGFHNTQLIRLSLGTNINYAASIVDFENGWYLPSSGQLRKLYATLPIIEEAIIKAGGSLMTNGKYWSSTEYSPDYASTPGFGNSCTYKTSNCRVRAIRNYYPAGDYEVLLAPNNENYGSVAGSGTYILNQTVTVTATPNEGYQFDHWTEDGATVSFDATYQFPFTRSRALVAHFVVPYSVGSIVTNSDGSRGVVFYSDPSGIGGLMMALVDVPGTCAWSANADNPLLTNQNPAFSQQMLNDMDGYSNTNLIRQWQSNNSNYAAGKVDFDHEWYLPSAGELRKLYAALPLIEEALVCAGGSLMTGDYYWSSSEHSSDRAWSPAFQFTITYKTSKLRVRPVRSILPMMTIEVEANLPSAGTVTGAGCYCVGKTCTLTATPNIGYSFVNWTKDGTVVSSNPTYSFIVSNSGNYVANFEQTGHFCNIVFDLRDSNGDGWNGNKLVLNYGSTTEQLTITSGSSASYIRSLPTGEHVALSWISGSWISECSFTVRYEDGETILEARNLNNSFSFGFDVDCVGDFSQTTNLGVGWNWFSSHIAYDESSLAYLQAQLDAGGVAATIKSQNGYITNESGSWLGSLTTLDNTQMYMINTSQSLALTLYGPLQVPANTPITLKPGWTWFAYFKDTPMTVEQAFSGFTLMDGDIIKSQNGFSTYSAFEGWVGSCRLLEPGKGYMFMNNGTINRILLYP